MSVVSLGPVLVSASVVLESTPSVVLTSGPVVVSFVVDVAEVVALIDVPSVSDVPTLVPPIGRQTFAVHTRFGPQFPWGSHSQTAVPGVQSSGMQTLEGVHSRSGSQTPSRHSQPKLPRSQLIPLVVVPSLGSVKHPARSATKAARLSALRDVETSGMRRKQEGEVRDVDSRVRRFLPNES